MYMITEAYRSATDLYWIAFLLTTRAELSLGVTIDALNSRDEFEDMCSPQTLAHLRKTVIIAAFRDALFC